MLLAFFITKSLSCTTSTLKTTFSEYETYEEIEVMGEDLGACVVLSDDTCNVSHVSFS